MRLSAWSKPETSPRPPIRSTYPTQRSRGSYKGWSVTFRFVWPLPFRFANGSGELEVSPSHRLLANDTNAYLAAGLAGLGIIQAPAYAVHAALESGKLVAVLDEWRPASVPVHVICPSNRFLSATRGQRTRVRLDQQRFDRLPQVNRPSVRSRLAIC